MSGARLCYVSANVAWFTTAEKQWGDDWDDAPYEHNAGEPYEYRPTHSILREGALVTVPNPEPPYELTRLVFLDGGLETPDTWHTNSPYSVERINAGAVPWLVTSKYHSGPTVAINAGATVDEFKRLVRESGGVVYVPEPAAVPA